MKVGAFLLDIETDAVEEESSSEVSNVVETQKQAKDARKEQQKEEETTISTDGQDSGRRARALAAPAVRRIAMENKVEPIFGINAFYFVLSILG